MTTSTEIVDTMAAPRINQCVAGSTMSSSRSIAATVIAPATLAEALTIVDTPAAQIFRPASVIVRNDRRAGSSAPNVRAGGSMIGGASAAKIGSGASVSIVAGSSGSAGR